MKSPSAYLLVSHGSRDPRPQAEVEKLAVLVSQKLKNGNWTGVASPLIGTACLELAPLPLHRQIEEFGILALASGVNRVEIVPLFLLPGVHVMEDIPSEVDRALLGLNLKIEIRPHLGAHPGLGHLLADQIPDFDADAKILLSHGSRRPNGNQPVEELAARLGAVAAYWSVSPSLEMRVQELVGAGYRKIAIIPYFLFPGGIADAIARAVEVISQELPAVDLSLTAPIGASNELADLILDLVQDSPSPLLHRRRLGRQVPD